MSDPELPGPGTILTLLGSLALTVVLLITIYG